MLKLFSRMSDRERVVVAGALAVIIGIAVYAVVFEPLATRGLYWRTRADNVRSDYTRFLAMREEYLALKTATAGLERKLTTRDSGSSLLSRIEGTARRLGLSERITSMKPYTSDLEPGIVESSVEIRLEKMELGGLVSFLGSLEREEPNLQTDRLRVKARFDDPQLLDVTVQITVLEAG